VAFRNLDEYLLLREEKMIELGFSAEKIDLCLSDIRNGAITLLEAARQISRSKSGRNNQTEMFFVELETWVEGRRRQRRE
jgi:hypothetical protein